MKPISIKSAKYIESFKLEIILNDGVVSMVDFGDFLLTHNHPQYNKYKKEENFKRFKIENGNVIWGKDWDMIFPLYDLYKGKINYRQN